MLASCDTELCVDDLWERESVLQGVCFSVRNQTFSLTFQRTLSAKLSARLQLGLGKDGKAGVPAAVRGKKAHEIKSDRK